MKTVEAIKNCETVSAIQKILMEKEIPPRVEYSLSEMGKSFMKVLKVMQKWGEENLL
ncbi:winged helix-turn-helix transcriptional regulator [Treponema denticola]|uniref:winged helix-turn-helix transcriptional regulator n=1 Tax=Treponema denticola TaxID=158 RepID=UPI0002B57EC5|nr:winged helix-turn-helix transcriptional regulator [Treponema denticola]EMB23216.1 hypothetical protein HMPREF9724_01485 [Treponema denticola SP37]EPF34753.1 hypothetical protein HMPREF9734_00294 [Treponema denticola SP44]EPF38355.1 hypothetical protein HMPREF9731_02363 [Treponema denticola SP23]